MNYEIQTIVQQLMDERKNQYEYFLNLPESSLISIDSPKKKKRILLPQYEIGGKKKNMGKKKEKTFPIIPIDDFNEFHRIKAENESLKKQIPKIQEQINKLIKKNQEGQTFIREAEKSIKEMEVEKFQKEEVNRQKFEEMKMVRRKEQIEKNRSESSIKKIKKGNQELEQKRDEQARKIEKLKLQIEKVKQDDSKFDLESEEKLKKMIMLRNLYKEKIGEKIQLMKEIKGHQNK